MGRINVCVFKVKEEYLQHTTVHIKGRKMNIQNVNHAIIAKISYANHSEKHGKDLDVINPILDKYFK